MPTLRFASSIAVQLTLNNSEVQKRCYRAKTYHTALFKNILYNTCREGKPDDKIEWTQECNGKGKSGDESR